MDDWLIEWMNEWMNECMIEWLNDWLVTKQLRPLTLVKIRTETKTNCWQIPSVLTVCSKFRWDNTIATWPQCLLILNILSSLSLPNRCHFHPISPYFTFEGRKQKACDKQSLPFLLAGSPSNPGTLLGAGSIHLGTYLG